MTNNAPKTPRIGFMKERLSSPDNFNRMNTKEITEMFYGKVDADVLAERPDGIEEGRFNLDK